VECSRDKAEAVLSLSRQYGSVLLRPVSSEPNNKYALSYREETAGSVTLLTYLLESYVSSVFIVLAHHITIIIHPRCRGFESRWLRRPSCVATVGQLLSAPWAWAYSTLHPLGVGK